jgi:hypothetical protein
LERRDVSVHPVEVSAPTEPAVSAAHVMPAPALPNVAALPAASAADASIAHRVGAYGNRALAELTYQARRAGASTLAGIAAAVLALAVFLANNLPQGGVVAALRNQLSNAAPGVGGTVAAPLSGAALSALPPRSEAPQIVAKILEEARASGVELPRGQYEYIPARDGVASLYRMTFPVHATYPQLRTFMDRTLLALPAVAVDGMRIERKAVGEDAVDAELKFSAFVRSDP